MKKIALITQAKDALDAIKALRKLGVVHVEHLQVPKGKEISQVQEDLSLANQAIDIISRAEFTSGCEGSVLRRNITDWKSAARHIIDVWKRLDQLQEFSRKLTLQIKEWQPWGDFDPAMIRQLETKNLLVKLYQVPVKEVDNFPEDVVVKKVFTKSNLVYCAVFSQKGFSCAYKEVELPKMGLFQMQQRLAEDWRIIESLNDDLRGFFCYQPKLIAIKNSLDKELEFQQALSGMAHSGVLSYLCGYAPIDSIRSFASLAKKEGWGFLVNNPGEDDAVPTYIRNPGWVSIIKPVFQMIQVVPGYRELDVSPLFLLFLSLFFGMIIGDAGYGLVYMLLTYFAQRKWGRKMKDKSIFFLFYLFSFCAIIWGFLTGTVFGQEWYFARGFKALLPILNDIKFLQAFCFFLGAFHLTLAHAWRAFLKLPSLGALADAGWICLLWAGFFLAKLLILGDSFPYFVKWLIYIGITLVIFCTSPQKNIFKAIGKGLATVALSLMNNFTDVVSYIRLFAVGLAGVAVANTVNSIAAGAGNNMLAKILILAVGHTINIMLGPMSVLVHGIRLNVLEFSGHANVTWSGVAYKPLKD